jgi:hypothetical protein
MLVPQLLSLGDKERLPWWETTRPYLLPENLRMGAHCLRATQTREARV